MSKALALAKKSQGSARPNPSVGAIIVKDKKIVGKGSHEVFGKDHAEVVAIKEAGLLAKGADLYVTLEPCSHQGKTPPCTNTIISAGICVNDLRAWGFERPLITALRRFCKKSDLFFNPTSSWVCAVQKDCKSKPISTKVEFDSSNWIDFIFLTFKTSTEGKTAFG